MMTQHMMITGTLVYKTYSFAAVSLPLLCTATFETRNIEKYWVTIKWNGAVSCKPRFCVNVTWCGQFACRRSAASVPPLNTRWLHCVTGHVTACFLSLFVRLSACLRLILCINVWLFSLSRAFISFPPPCLFIFIRGLSLSLFPTVAPFPSVPLFSVFCILSLLLSFYVYLFYACNFFFIFCSFVSPIIYLITFCTRDSSVSTVTGLRAGRPTNELKNKRPTWCHNLLSFISLLLCSTCFGH